LQQCKGSSGADRGTTGRQQRQQGPSQQVALGYATGLNVRRGGNACDAPGRSSPWLIPEGCSGAQLI